MDEKQVEKDPFQMALERLGTLFFSLANEETRDRGKLASLRKGIGEPGCWHPATAMVVDQALGDVRLKYRSDEDVLFMVAALFSLHPQISQEGHKPSFMYSFKRAMGVKSLLGDDARASTDRRILALLNANQDDLFHHLRHQVGMFRTTGVGINWLGLARDLHAWDHPDRWVQRKWARDWWGTSPHADNESMSSDVSEDSAE